MVPTPKVKPSDFDINVLNCLTYISIFLSYFIKIYVNLQLFMKQELLHKELRSPRCSEVAALVNPNMDNIQKSAKSPDHLLCEVMHPSKSQLSETEMYGWTRFLCETRVDRDTFTVQFYTRK